eukprot:CAMPEP_0178906048 /NCGR_PEP_ID=MMETSP0786-20121207/6616_1 /TAXON_ID=186022 /ORGANISM="Thalassionema frauenfeldii, Strain CCMP 1798" /LENGTH=815 /DNA_ID=CAMNT_0020577727 /DNA_START=54 /DNA_END=2498 /DNA_ORIENTATION=+
MHSILKKSGRGLILGCLSLWALVLFTSTPSISSNTTTHLRRFLNGNNNNNNYNHNYDAYNNYNNGHYESHNDHHELENENFIITCIVFGLLTLTIIFETAKHSLEHSVTEDMKPVLEKLFGEMTVLGFLSMVTFVFNVTNLFGYLSTLLVGSEDEEEHLLHIFEDVHFAIFFLMVFYMVQALVLIHQALQTEAMWVKFDKEYLAKEMSTTHDASNKVQAQRTEGSATNNSNVAVLSASTSVSWWHRIFYFCSPYQKEQHLQVDQAYFNALREEFLADRSSRPPFAPSHQNVDASPADFNFGRYLGLCLVRFCARVVDVTNTTLSVMAVGTALWYVYSTYVLLGHPVALAWSWLSLGWILVGFHIYLERHILQVRRQLVPEASRHLMPLYQNHDKGVAPIQNNNNTPFQSISGNDLTLPAWCSVDLERYVEEKNNKKKKWYNYFCCCLFGSSAGNPNRQDTLYWMDRYGPTFYLILLQINILFIGVDCAMQIMIFLPTIYSTASSPVTLVVYGLLALGSVILNLLWRKYLVANLAVVCSMGSHRNINAIADVYRESKTETLVRCLLILYRLQHFVSEVVHEAAAASSSDKHKQQAGTTDDTQVDEGAAKAGARSSTNESTTQHYEDTLDLLEIVEISKTLENFVADRKSTPTIQLDGFRSLMNSLSEYAIPEENIQTLFSSLDLDGNGTITKEEFLQWYSDNMMKDDDDVAFLQQAPRVLFALFDEDGSGEITLSELQQTLTKKLQILTFTVEEQIGIMQQIDRDGSGTISEHEFELLFQKFPPTELLRKEKEKKRKKTTSNAISSLIEIILNSIE